MLGVLKANHNFKISMISLERKLKKMELSKYSNVSDETVRQIVRKEKFKVLQLCGVITLCGVN